MTCESYGISSWDYVLISDNVREINGTGPKKGMPGVARGPKRVRPEWHGAYMACPENNEMIKRNEIHIVNV